MKYDLIFRIIEIWLQLALVIIATVALFSWKREIRGRDRYNFSKELLHYIKGIRFMIYSAKGSMHQIYLNDILSNRKKFYEEQLFPIAEEVAYFDHSVWGLFSHLETRSDIFVPEKIRNIIDEIRPMISKRHEEDKKTCTYVQVFGVEETEVLSLDKKECSKDWIYIINRDSHTTIEEYFKKWEKLLNELLKIT